MEKKLFLLLPVALITVACDPVIDCECTTPDITIQYKSDSLSCIKDFADFIKVSSYDVSSNDTLEEFVYFNSWECNVILYPTEDRYWVISSDSLHIQDTLKIRDITYGQWNSSNVRCECPAPINTIETNINGESYSGRELERKY